MILASLSKLPTTIVLVTAVLCNVLAQVTMKIYSAKSAALVSSSLLPIACSVLFYGVSFALTIVVLQKAELSLAGPVMAGMTFALVFVAGVLMFGEAISVHKIIGLLLIIAGVVFITRGAHP